MIFTLVGIFTFPQVVSSAKENTIKVKKRLTGIYLEGKHVEPFFDNDCSLSVDDVSPIIDVNGFATLALYVTPTVENEFSFNAEASLDGENWFTQLWFNRDRSDRPLATPILAPHYRLKVTRVPAGEECLTVEAYLLPYITNND